MNRKKQQQLLKLFRRSEEEYSELIYLFDDLDELEKFDKVIDQKIASLKLGNRNILRSCRTVFKGWDHYDYIIARICYEYTSKLIWFEGLYNKNMNTWKIA